MQKDWKNKKNCCALCGHRESKTQFLCLSTGERSENKEILLDLLDYSQHITQVQIVNGLEPDKIIAAVNGEQVGSIIYRWFKLPQVFGNRE